MTDTTSFGPASVSATPVGVVGLGRMGLAMAARLSTSGCQVVGYDRDPSARRVSIDVGLDVVDSLVALGGRCDTVLVVVAGDANVIEVCNELGHLPDTPDLIVVCSSVDRETVIRAGAAVRARRPERMTIDAALVRGEAAARNGTLGLYCGGDKAAFEYAYRILTSVASDVYYVGSLGNGQLVKTLNNFLLWSNVAATYEAMLVAVRLGLDPELVQAAVLSGSGSSYVLETWRQSRPMTDVEEGMDRFLRLGMSLGVPLPLAESVSQRITQIKNSKDSWLNGAGTAESMDAFVRASFK